MANVDTNTLSWKGTNLILLKKKEKKKKHPWFYQNIIWNWYPNAWVFDWEHICFVLFGGRVFQQTVGITMGTNCVPILADFPLFVRSRFHTRTSHEKQQEASPIL